MKLPAIWIAITVVALTAICAAQTRYKDYTARGVVYERTDLRTGKHYVGQAWDWERYERRQKEEAEAYRRKAGQEAKYDFKVLARPLQSELDMVEQAFINKRGGIEKRGGPLENARQQVRDYEREAERRRTETARERNDRRNDALDRSRRISEDRKEQMRRDNAERARRLKERGRKN